MEASNGAGLAVATSAEDDLRQQPMLKNANGCRTIIGVAGGPPTSGTVMTPPGRGLAPFAAAGLFRLLPVVAPRDLPHAPEWNELVARFMAA